MKTDKDFIEYLQKELIDMIYDKEISSDVMKVFNKIIAKWKEATEIKC